MSETKLKNYARQTLTVFLKSKGLRKTPERFAILEHIFDMNEHFYVESLSKRMEASQYRVSRATLYNTLQLLIEAGLVRKHQFENQPAQYERVVSQSMSNHHHLLCRVCGKVKEVKDPELVKLLESRRYRTFSADFFTLYVYGMCSTCKRKLKKDANQHV